MPKKADTKVKAKKVPARTRRRRGIRLQDGVYAADLFEGCALTEDEREALGLSHMGHDGEL